MFHEYAYKTYEYISKLANCDEGWNAEWLLFSEPIWPLSTTTLDDVDQVNQVGLSFLTAVGLGLTSQSIQGSQKTGTLFCTP